MHRSRISVWSKIALPMVVAFLGLSGCLAPGTESTTAQSSDNEVTAPAANPTGVAYFGLELSPENANIYTRVGTCALEEGQTTTSCTIRVPEGKLQFSDLRFVYGTSDYTACSQVVFIPPLYTASVTVGFDPYWDAALPNADCSVLDGDGNPTNFDCYWGPARKFYPSGGQSGTYIVPSSLSAEGEIDLQSMNRDSLASAPHFGNVGVCNKMDDPSVAVAGAYVANTMAPYVVECRDRFYQLRGSVEVYIADEDLETGEDPGVPTNDHFYDWSQTL